MIEKKNVLLVSFNNCHEPHYFSLALGYLKAYALDDSAVAEAHNIEIIDFCTSCNDPMQAAFYISNAKPDIVGLSCYCWNAKEIIHLAEVLKQVLPGVKVVAGGPQVTPVAEEFLSANRSFDVVVRGEGEASFRGLLRAWMRGEDLSRVQGVSYREGENVFANEARALIEDLDEIPSPYLTGILQPREHVTYLESYRGCPYSCGYCYEGKDYPKLRHFSAERLRAEVRLVASTPEVTTYSFIDSVFNLTEDKLREMAELLAPAAEAGKTIHTVEVMAEHVDEETVRLLKKAGAVSTETGPQAVNPATVSNINRFFKSERFVRGVEAMREGGLKVLCDLIIGLPGDDFFGFCRSTRFVLDLRPGTVIFSTLHVLPGTMLRDEAGRFGLKYDEEPPHYILETTTFPFEEVRKAEIFAKSIEAEYNATA